MIGEVKCVDGKIIRANTFSSKLNKPIHVDSEIVVISCMYYLLRLSDANLGDSSDNTYSPRVLTHKFDRKQI